VIYFGHLCGSLSTTFEYILTCFSWKQALYKKQQVVYSLTYVVHSARHMNTYIHVSIGNKQFTNPNNWFTLLTYVVHSTRYLNTYIHASIRNKQFTKNQQVVYSAHVCGSLSTTFEYILTCLGWKQVLYKK